MKSKKLMGLFLAAAVATGVLGAGTFGGFTDSATTEANITINMGNLDIQVDELPEDEQWWVKVGSETDEEEGGFNPTDYFSNVRPGDTFTRTIPVENVGTLAAKTTLEVADLSGTVVGTDKNGNSVYFDQVFEFTAELKGEELTRGVLTEVVIERATLAEINLVLTVREDMDNEFNIANDDNTDLIDMITFDLNEALGTEFIKINATQVNAQ